jgi:hypothetical protein
MAQLYSPEEASLDLLKVFAQFNKYVSYSFFSEAWELRD